MENCRVNLIFLYHPPQGKESSKEYFLYIIFELHSLYVFFNFLNKNKGKLLPCRSSLPQCGGLGRVGKSKRVVDRIGGGWPYGQGGPGKGVEFGVVVKCGTSH